MLTPMTQMRRAFNQATSPRFCWTDLACAHHASPAIGNVIATWGAFTLLSVISPRWASSLPLPLGPWAISSDRTSPRIGQNELISFQPVGHAAASMFVSRSVLPLAFTLRGASPSMFAAYQQFQPRFVLSGKSRLALPHG